MFKKGQSIYVVSVVLLITIINNAFGANITYKRTKKTSPLKIGTRHRVTESPMIYGRIQPYDLYSNYLHRWIDRPLFHNRKWRESSQRAALSFAKDISIVQEYDIDGFTILGNAYRNRYRKYLNIIEKKNPDNFRFMPGMAWSRGYDEQSENNFQLGLNSKFSPRINGKVPFFPYGGASLEKLQNTRKKLTADGFKNVLLFNGVWLNVFAAFNNGTISDAVLKKAESNLEKKLSLADGVVLTNYHMHRNPLGDYTLSRRFYYDLDNKYIAPLVEKIYAKKENKDKLLGFNVRHGYTGFMSGTNEGEYGTSQLRDAMDTALLFNPDIISLVEWNEANENTSFQPTVYNSKSLQRIIKFYARILKRLPPAPNQGDDLNIPNMIVSIRQTLALGEKYRIELLNVPDSNKTEKYTVQLTLKNQKGEIIKQFKPDIFSINQLTAVTYTIPSEQLAQHLAILPELKIEGFKDKGEIKIKNLGYTRLEPTVCWNFKELRQPLRDLLRLDTIDFNVTPADQGKTYKISGTVKSKPERPLASVEVLNCEDEVFAVDPANEFKLNNNYLFRFTFSTKTPGLRNTEITIPGINDFIFKPWSYPYAGFGRLKKVKDKLKGRVLFFGHGASMLFAIPKNKIEKAKIQFDVKGMGKFSFTASNIIQKSKIVRELPGFTTVTAQKLENLADHPLHLNKKDVEFATAVKSEFYNPCFHLRIISADGKIYRSDPVFPRQLDKQKVSLNVFSAFAGKAVKVKVAENRIPNIRYSFVPEYGQLLRAPGYPEFDAYLGGGFGYCWPMRYGKLPGKAKQSSPEWIKENNSWSLKFDGVSNYIVFPVETIPHGSFTLEFECKTSSNENQVLFRHYSHSPGSIMLYIIDGKLKADFVGMGRNLRGKINHLPVNLDFPTEKWVRVKISYNLKNIIFSINGKIQKIPFRQRGAKPTAAIFGGFASNDRDVKNFKNLNFFKGELRSFRVLHNAEK